MPECPSPLLGRDFLSALGSTFALPENENKAYFWLNYVLYKTQTVQPIFSPEIGKLTDPQISDQRIPGWAKFATLLKITIKEASIFLPSMCQFPIKPEAQQGLKP